MYSILLEGWLHYILEFCSTESDMLESSLQVGTFFLSLRVSGL